MPDEERNAIDILSPGSRKRGGKNKLFLIISVSVLVVALAVSAVLLLGSAGAVKEAERVIELGTALQGVSVGGVDISGMTKEEALAATSQLPTQLLAKANFTIDVNREKKSFAATDFSLTTDYEQVIEKAMEYGRTGNFSTRLEAANTAKTSGMNFPVSVVADETQLKAALTALKSELDTPAIDAKADFAPWGVTEEKAADGTVKYSPYTPDLATIIDYCNVICNGKEYTKFPKLVRLAEADKANKLRYQYWNDRKGSDGAYEENYVPRDADVARFIYTKEVDGLVVDIDAIFDAVMSQVKSGTYETIVAPVEVTPATKKLEDVKKETQLIASWSSSYGGSGHQKDYDRNYNVDMIASLLNGTVVQPGGTMSVNEIVGARSAATAPKYGWRKASGIENGGYSPQYGGGVCQLGSTTYNAAIRSGLFVVESHHHSIPSAYVPIGLDATLNSGNLDLKLRNDATTALYMVTYNNPTERCVTVEFYGVPLTDSTGQQIILKYESKNLGKYGSPTAKTVIVPAGYVCEDETVISLEKPTYEYAKNRQGTIAQSYKLTYKLDGTPISKEDFIYYKYPVVNGKTYVLDPASIPTPAPSPSATATASS